MKVASFLNFNLNKNLIPPSEDKAGRPRVKLTIEYDGSQYFGWQYQGPGKPTIQEKLEEALLQLFKEKVSVIGSGRTDKGVHAINQAAHFDAPRDVSHFDLIRAFWPYLPSDIAVKDAKVVSSEFHAQRSAVSKKYIYRILNRHSPSALYAKRALWIRKPLNLELLNEGAQLLIGTHDFNCFRSEGSYVKDTIRTIFDAKFLKSGDFVEFHIRGSGFLKQMVRNIVGTLLELELRGRTMESLKTLILSRDRKLAGPTVQPQGLYLAEVFYPPNLDNTAQPQ